MKIPKKNYLIEKEIPLPKRNPCAISNTIRAMKMGDSVFFKTEKERWAFRQIAHKLGAIITTKKVEGGSRAWMIQKATH